VSCLACLGVRTAVLLVLLLAGCAGLAWAGDADPEISKSVTGREMETLQHYSRDATDDWLKRNLGLSLSDFELVWDPGTLSFEQRSTLDKRSQAEARKAKKNAPLITKAKSIFVRPERQSSLSLSLQQSSNLGRLAGDLRDVPFGVEVKGDLPVLARLTALETRFWVPLSWKDEWRAAASLPLQWPGSKGTTTLGKELGFSRRLSLRSDLSSQLGRNAVQAGVMTDWSSESLGIWTLDYDYHVKYGQGTAEAIHWLKLSKEF